jgi:hypothetical protein
MGDTMRKPFAAFALAAFAFAQPAGAITFPGLTTIYIGMGVEDSGGAANTGAATLFQCSNVSGTSAQVRFLVLSVEGTFLGQNTVTIPHGGGRNVSTHFTGHFPEDGVIAPDVTFSRGTVNIESTQSGVFCQGFIVDAAAAGPTGIPLRFIRVNPHPGTVE